jgi:uncharacterized protein YbjT (DUF2867 family)
MKRVVFITGGTGYMGKALIPELTRRGHEVIALARPASASKLPPNCRAIHGDPLDRKTFVESIPAGCTFVQLVGVPHPSPAKAKQFREIDLVSVRESAAAATAARVAHFIYLSVAQPAPMMRDYIAVRAKGETMIRASGMPATFLRPWYVLGPGHRWPYVLLPFYWLFEQIPVTRDGARRLGLIKLEQMIAAVAKAVEFPPEKGTRIWDVPQLRAQHSLAGCRKEEAPFNIQPSNSKPIS